MRSYTFSAPIKLPGLNEYTYACRSHAQVGAALKRETEEALRWFIRAQLGKLVKDKKLPARAPVKVYFRWTEAGKRPRDKDNIAFAKKFVLDALVAENVLLSDAWDYVDSFEDSFFRGPRYGVTVDITVLDKEKD